MWWESASEMQDVLVLNNFQPDIIAARRQAHGAHSFFTIKVPTTSKLEGIMIPLTFCFEKNSAMLTFSELQMTVRYFVGARSSSIGEVVGRK
tara:strand:+ start:583 stop:858 length:276 start_codon:yes stop_codon:yes gene_type:complete